MALLQSAILMLRHIGEERAADRIYGALLTILEKGEVRTRDLGGNASTTAFTSALIEEIQRG